jgi:hypothetical protein
MSLDNLRDYMIQVLGGLFPRHPVQLSSLVAGLDKLQECGRQHVFLYRMATDRREESLAQLRDEAFIRRRIEGCDAADCLNSNRFIWDTEKPELAAVRHNQEHLLLQWVETRTWMKKTETQVDPKTGKKVDVSIPQNERACTFFHIDLRTGRSELLIQALHENPNQSLRREVEIYRQLVTQTLGLDPCLPVTLEPVIRMLLIDRTPDIRRWIVVLASGGWLDGHDAPGPDAEQLKSGEFAGLELHYDWHSPDAAKNKVRVRLFARTDHFDVHSPCRPKDHRALLAEIRGYGEDEESILDPDLRAVAERDPSLYLVMHKLDLHFSRSQGIERCSIIAHSFGTYLVAAAIEIYGLSFDKIILCGSIVRRDFPWSRFLHEGRVRKVFNDCGRDDLWVKLVVWCVKDSGASGVFKFMDDHRRLLQHVHSEWGHSDFFYLHNYNKRWIPFLKGEKPQEIESDAKPGK